MPSTSRFYLTSKSPSTAVDILDLVRVAQENVSHLALSMKVGGFTPFPWPALGAETGQRPKYMLLIIPVTAGNVDGVMGIQFQASPGAKWSWSLKGIGTKSMLMLPLEDPVFDVAGFFEIFCSKNVEQCDVYFF